MDNSLTTPAASSTITDTSSAASAPSHLLEINLISAHDLPKISKSMKTYAVAWLHPNRKLTTRVDSKGHSNPYWNEKLYFRVEDTTLYSETSFLTVEIYTVSWFRDILVGIVRIPMNDLLCPNKGKRFLTLQIRRPSGEPQGILNMGFSVDGSPGGQTVPLPKMGAPEKVVEVDDEEDEVERERRLRIQEKIQLWRSRSVDADDEGSMLNMGSVVNGSVVNGSMVNGSEVCSDVGPSASIVAAEMAKRPHRPPVAHPMAVPSMSVALPPRAAIRGNAAEAEEMGSSILEELTLEEAMAKGWMDENGDRRGVVRRNQRRHSDGDGLFSCFGTVYGIEVHIVCGNKANGNKKGHNNNNKNKKTKPKPKNKNSM